MRCHRTPAGSNFAPIADAVTAIARWAESTVMNILCNMTGHAGLRQHGPFLIYQRVLVAGVAARRLVSAIEPEFGPPVMVEIPRLPRPRIVAGFTTGAEALLVHVLLRMATHAFTRRVAELRRLVAVIAFRPYVRAEQREAAPVVIKRRILPVFLVVAVLASCAELALVLVILAVTAHAVDQDMLFVHRSLVALSAFRRLVFAAQHVARIKGMIEEDLFPILCVMTTLAFLAVSPLVGVIFCVATVARGRQLLQVRPVFAVTRFAFGRLVSVDQRELRLVMVEVRNLPRRFVVTALAFLTL